MPTDMSTDERKTNSRKARSTDPTSFTSQLKLLNVGEFLMKGDRIDNDLTMGEFAGRAREMKNALRNRVAPSVRDASDATGYVFTIEITTSVTTPGNVYLVAFVSRVE